jgi:hypothetical protein
VREALAICLERRHLRRTLRIALVVGLVLTAINQLDVIVRGDATALTGVKIALNFCVPFRGVQPRTASGRRATDGAERDGVHGR